MKTSTLNLLTFFIVFIFLSNLKLNAQLACPYPITSTLPCDAVIAYTFHDDPNTCLEICSGTITVPANGSAFIQCCPKAVYITLHVNQVGSNVGCGSCNNYGDKGCPQNTVGDCPISPGVASEIPDCSCNPYPNHPCFQPGATSPPCPAIGGGPYSNAMMYFFSSGATLNP